MRFVLASVGLGMLHFIASFIIGFMGGMYGGFWRVLTNIITFPLSLLPSRVNLDGTAGWVAWGLLSLA